MKKIFIILLVFTLAIIPVFAFANSYSNMTFNELKTELDKIFMEMAKKDINTDKLICDSDGIKFYITGELRLEDSWLSENKILYIPYTAINESNQDLQIVIEKFCFNGWEVGMSEIYSLDANKKMKSDFIVINFISGTDLVDVSQIKEIEAYYYILDKNMNTITDNCRTTVLFN